MKAIAQLKYFLAVVLLMLPVVANAQWRYVTNDDRTITITLYTGTNTSVITPCKIDGMPVTRIGGGTFIANYQLFNITISDGVGSIGVMTFAACYSLTNITISGSVTNIGVAAFIRCHELKSVLFRGAAPNFDVLVDGDRREEIFSDDNITIYRLPGTIGWSNSFCGRPVVIWNPPVATNAAVDVKAK